MADAFISESFMHRSMGITAFHSVWVNNTATLRYPSNNCCIMDIFHKSVFKSFWLQKLKETEAEKNTETKEEVVKVQLDIVPGPTEKKRKSSINLYQGVDDDHPDLQSIQNIVANMTFSAD